MATLVCSPNKLSLEPKHSRLSLKKIKLEDNETSDFFSLKKELPEESQKKEIEVDDYVEKLEKDLVCLGLPNCGNTCYLNSIVQVLRFTPNFMQKVHTVLSYQKQLKEVFSIGDEEHGIFFYRLHILYMSMRKQEAFLKEKDGIDMSSFLMQNLESFLLSLRNISSSFEEGEQHDAHELLVTILSAFNAFCDTVQENISKCLRNSQSPGSSEVLNDQASIPNTLNASLDKEQRVKNPTKRKRKIRNNMKKSPTFPFYDKSASDLGFQGTMRHIIKCLECEKKSEMTEMFTNLDISIADDRIIEGTINLRECLEQKTVLNGENKYFCDECYQRNEALSSYDIISPPSVLLLHCSWLRQSSNMTDVEKDTTKILIPLFLKTSENPHIFCCKSEEIYCLYAVVLHIGTSTEVGHYVAFIKDASKTHQMAEVTSSFQNYFATNCCATTEILNYKIFTSTVNNWLLFDDDEVSSFYVDEPLEIFPYFDYLGITASPCMIFYFKM